MKTRGAQRKPSKFSASATIDPPIKLIKINGAKYEAVDTQDGYHTVRNVPILSEIEKGTHGAPYKVGKPELEKFRDVMQSRYSKGNKTGALSIGHNDDFGLTHPSFAGFFLPNRVGPCKMANGSVKETLFGDMKIPNDKFADFAAGKLPFHSPEIYPSSWEEYKIDIVSFLDTKPPYFDWAQNTVGGITTDPASKFEANWEDPAVIELKAKLLKGDLKALLGSDLKAIAARFEFSVNAEEGSKKRTEGAEGNDAKEEPKKPFEKNGEKTEGKPGEKPTEKFGEKPEGKEGVEGEGEGDGKFAAEYPEVAQQIEALATSMSKMAEALGMNGIDSTNKKPDATPVEPEEKREPAMAGGSKMSMDPETAAKFAAQQNEIVEIKTELATKRRDEKIAAFKAQADKKLSKKIVSAPGIVAKFAADAADMKEGGDKWFNETIDQLVPMLKDKPPSTVEEFMTASEPSADPANPVLSKFAAKGVDMNLVSRFSAQYRQIKTSPAGRHFSFTEEAYIENELLQAANADRKE